jgi:hypothetical protein
VLVGSFPGSNLIKGGDASVLFGRNFQLLILIRATRWQCGGETRDEVCRRNPLKIDKFLPQTEERLDAALLTQEGSIST